MRKNISVILYAIITFSIFLAGCSSTKNNIPFEPTTSSAPQYITETTVASPTPEAANQSIISPKEALELMYGKDKPFSADNKTVSLKREDGSAYLVGINTLVCYWEYQSEKCMVITEYNYGECHPCSAYIGGAIFRKTYTGWQMDKFDFSIVALGSFGHIANGELVRIGEEKYGVLIKSGYSGQGSTNGFATIIAETESFFGVVLHYASSAKQEQYQNGVNVVKWGYDSDLGFQSGENNKYYNIVITYYGTNQDGQIPATQVYKFIETKYNLAFELK